MKFQMSPLTLSLLLASTALAMPLQAQIPSLPPGTSIPNDAPAAKPSPLQQAEDAILHNDYAKALVLLNDAIAKQPNDARALYDRGYIEVAQKQPDAAASDFRRAIAADPAQFESRAALGRLLAQQQKFSDARKQLESAALLTPASGNVQQLHADVFRLLAQVDRQLHDTSAASDALIAALKLSPEQPDDTLLAAGLADDQGDAPAAETEYRKALAASPNSLEAQQGLANMLIQQKKFADAEPVLRNALSANPGNAHLIAQLASTLAAEGKQQEAIAQLETLHQQDPTQPEVTRMLADLYSTSGATAKATPLYVQLLAADPKNPELLTSSGENLIREQLWTAAVQQLQQSVALKPDQPDAWSSLAFAASQDHEYQLVLDALAQRANYGPDPPAALFLRATALDHLHRTKEAAACYRQFLAASQDKFPDEEWEARQRLAALAKSH